MRLDKITSKYDQLSLALAISEPLQKPTAIVVFSHGMAEHKERYFPFMEFLSEHGFVCAIHDHRGHGESVKSKEDYGYFYTDDVNAIVDDLHTVVEFMKKKYPGIPCYLFSHSMGTLVARCFLKKYDGEIDKLVLCGPPTQNPAVGAGLLLAKIMKPFFKAKSPNKILDGIAFKGYNDGNAVPFGWLSVNPENVKRYTEDEKCGFVFTTNGFLNLFQLQKGAFDKHDWKPKNKKLPIHVIAGSDDPVIQSEEKFTALLAFLKEVGYTQISSKLYSHMRHEILNETDAQQVYEDVLNFFK